MKIFVAKHQPEAQIVFDLLRLQHIHCELKGGQLFGLQGELPFSDDLTPYIWLLNPYQEQQAQQVIAQYRQQGVEKLPNWICPQCDTHIEGQFAQCWQCETCHPKLMRE